MEDSNQKFYKKEMEFFLQVNFSMDNAGNTFFLFFLKSSSTSPNLGYETVR